MSEPPRLSRAELEAQRELLREAIADLPNATNPDRAAAEVMRALDAYMEGALPDVPPAREAPVTNFSRPHQSEVRWATWVVLGGAVLSTIVVSVVLAGGWQAGLAIVAIWAVALFALTST